MGGGTFRASVTLLVLSMATPSAAAQSIWQRTRWAHSAEERETLRSVERMLGGEAEELDLLRVRTAVVELMREQIHDVRTVVLLFHLRRQLGLGPPQGGLRRLSAVMTSELSHHDRALGYYELARLRLDLYWAKAADPRLEAPLTQESIQVGQSDLGRALSSAWEAELRAEVLSYRALTAFALQDYQGARADLLLVVDLAVSAASLREAYLGLGLVDLLLGEQTSALRFLQWSAALERGRSHALPLPAFSYVPLGPAERQTLEWTQTIANHLSERGAPRLEPEMCEQMRAADPKVAISFARINQRWLTYCEPR